MEKTVLDWKAPSERQMKELVKTLSNDKKKSFAESCIEKKDGKNTMNRTNAKTWLKENCADMIEWKNAPKNSRPKSSADEVAEWLNL